MKFAFNTSKAVHQRNESKAFASTRRHQRILIVKCFNGCLGLTQNDFIGYVYK